MTEAWKASFGLATALALLSGCGESVDPSAVNLTGRWRASPDALGVATIEVELTEANGELTGTGTYTGSGATLADGSLSATGIHLGGEVNVTLQFVPSGGSGFTQNLTGHIEDEDHFVLVFPAEPAAQVTFTRQ